MEKNADNSELLRSFPFPKGKTLLYFVWLLFFIIIKVFPLSKGKTFMLFFRLLRSFPHQWEDLTVILPINIILFRHDPLLKLRDISFRYFATYIKTITNRKI